MSIKVRCRCGKNITAKDEYAGRTVKCPGCQAPLLIPAPEEVFEVDEYEQPEEQHEDEEYEPVRSPKSKKTSKGKESAKAKGRRQEESSSPKLILAIGGGAGVVLILVVGWLFWPKGAAPQEAVNQVDAVSSAVGDAAVTAKAPEPVTAESELHELQGEWKLTQVDIDPSIPNAAKLRESLEGASWTIYGKHMDRRNSRGHLSSALELQVDISSSPKSMTMTNSQPGPDAPQVVQSVYFFEGDALKICTTEKGSVRPTALEPDKSKSEYLLTFSRGPSETNPPATVKPSELTRLKLMSLNVRVDFRKIDAEDRQALVVPAEVNEMANIELPRLYETQTPRAWDSIRSLSPAVLVSHLTSDATLRQASTHQGLIGVVLRSKHTATPAGFRSLNQCPNLQMIMFDQVPVTPDQLTALGEWKALTTLVFSQVPLSHEAIKSLPRRSEMRALEIGRSGVTDEDMDIIGQMTKLQRLNIALCPITDAGLKKLETLKDLKFLNARQTKVTAAGVEAFKAAVPLCNVAYESPQ